MDPVTLGTIVAALVAKAADDTADKTVDEVAGTLGRLVGRLRRRFTDDGDEAGAKALGLVEDVPDSPSRIAALADLLDQRANEVKGFRVELECLVAETRSAGVNVESISQTAVGDQNVLTAATVKSKVQVTYSNPLR